MSAQHEKTGTETDFLHLAKESAELHLLMVLASKSLPRRDHDFSLERLECSYMSNGDSSLPKTVVHPELHTVDDRRPICS